MTDDDSGVQPLEGTLERRNLLSAMRHQLRTPINHIVGYSEMLQEEVDGQDQDALVSDLKRIQAEGRQLLEVINDHLDPAQVEAGNISISRLRHELRTPLNSILGYSEMLEEQAVDQGRQDLASDLRKIGTAARNLLTFMIDSFSLEELDHSDPGSEAQDAGVSVVTLYQESTVSASYETDSHKPSTTPGTLLVVDDNEMNRDMLSRRLIRDGHTVMLAENGPRALEMLRSKSFDLVLLDVVMPKMNGYQVLSQLKADDSLRDIPVIMLSAMDEIDSVVRCIELGADDYLTKPINSVLLRARIGAGLENKRLRDQEVIYLDQIEQAKKRADDLLHVILPDRVVEELMLTNTVLPRRYEDVAVLFCDIVDFTAYCDRREPEEVIPDLQLLVESFEEITLNHNMEKIKTIGDSFMAAAGLLKPVDNSVLTSARCGLEMLEAVRQMPNNWRVRVGIHVGPLVAGVVGKRQYLFDVFGDTVNTAARIESNGMADSVNLSKAAWETIAQQCYGESLGYVQAKGKGELEIFRLGGFL